MRRRFRRRLGGLFVGGHIALAAGASQDLRDRQAQLAARDIDFDDARLHDVADADARAAALAAHDAGLLVDVPPVVHEILVSDQAVNKVRLELHEHAEVRDAGDDADEVFANVVLQQREDLDLSQLALGVVAAALGKADVAAELDEIVVGRDLVEDGFGFASALGTGGTSAAAE